MFRASTFLVPLLLSGGLALPAAAGAQLPGIPILQNAWANPGLTAAANFGSGGGAQAAALAGAWAPGSGRFQVSAGFGARKSDVGGRGSAYGFRAAMPVFSFAGGALGIAAFAGIGGAREPDVTVGLEHGGSVTQVPVGVGIGYRKGFSFIRGVSAYATPFYSYNRLVVGDSSVSTSGFRVSLGLDVGVTNRIGVTAGAELGAAADAGEPGPTGAVYGIGASWAFGRD